MENAEWNESNLFMFSLMTNVCGNDVLDIEQIVSAEPART